MKGPRAAALIAGWLAVALSMAALATAAISRVGTTNGGAQVQVTVTRTATVPATAPSPSLVTPQAVPVTTSTPDESASETSTAPVQTVATSSRPAVAELAVVVAPSAPAMSVSAVVAPPAPSTPTTSPSSNVTSSKPVPLPATSTPTAKSDTVSWLTWRRSQGGVRAGCHGSVVLVADQWAAKGYVVTRHSNWIRTVVVFDGPSPLKVLVDCHDRKPNFSATS